MLLKYLFNKGVVKQIFPKKSGDFFKCTLDWQFSAEYSLLFIKQLSATSPQQIDI